MFSNYTPSHILFDVVSDVIVMATNDALIRLIEEFLQLISLSRPHINYWAGPRAPCIKEGEQC